MEFSVQSVSAQETFIWGLKLGNILRGGDVIALIGDLGAGKTALAQGIGKALEVEEPLTSPTFTLMHEYNGFMRKGQDRLNKVEVKLVHMDLYRLKYPEEVEIIGVEDLFLKDTICLIEWPGIAQDYLPSDKLEIVIEGSGEMERRITFRALTGEWDIRLKALNARLA